MTKTTSWSGVRGRRSRRHNRMKKNGKEQSDEGDDDDHDYDYDSCEDDGKENRGSVLQAERKKEGIPEANPPQVEQVHSDAPDAARHTPFLAEDDNDLPIPVPGETLPKEEEEQQEEDEVVGEASSAAPQPPPLPSSRPPPTSTNAASTTSSTSFQASRPPKPPVTTAPPPIILDAFLSPENQNDDNDDEDKEEPGSSSQEKQKDIVEFEARRSQLKRRRRKLLVTSLALLLVMLLVPIVFAIVVRRNKNRKQTPFASLSDNTTEKEEEEGHRLDEAENAFPTSTPSTSSTSSLSLGEETPSLTPAPVVITSTPTLPSSPSSSSSAASSSSPSTVGSMRQPPQQPTLAPVRQVGRARQDYLYSLYVDLTTPEDLLRNETTNTTATPQHRAWQWMSWTDQSGLGDRDEERLYQRYIVLCLMFSLLDDATISSLGLLHPPDKHECEFATVGNSFSGIICTKKNKDRRRVQALDFYGAQALHGSLPSEMGYLSRLQWMDFSFNQLTGTLPATLGLLRRVDFFSVSHNLMTGTFPADRTFGHSTQLRTLRLDNNLWNTTLPRQWGWHFENLQSLDIRNNPGLHGTVPRSYANMDLSNSIMLQGTSLEGSLAPLCFRTPSVRSRHTFLADCFSDNIRGCYCCTGCYTNDGALETVPLDTPLPQPTNPCLRRLDYWVQIDVETDYSPFFHTWDISYVGDDNDGDEDGGDDTNVDGDNGETGNDGDSLEGRRIAAFGGPYPALSHSRESICLPKRRCHVFRSKDAWRDRRNPNMNIVVRVDGLVVWEGHTVRQVTLGEDCL